MGIESRPGTDEWERDLDGLLIPILGRLNSNEELAKAMRWALEYQRPRWVKSDPPGFRDLSALIEALKR
jgi:hypothetical protein